MNSSFRIRYRWLIINILIISLVAYIGLHPSPIPPFQNLNNHHLLSIRGDLLLHALTFLILTLTIPLLTQPALPFSLMIVGGMGAAWLTEFVQGLFPWKTFDWHDVVANAVGLVIGLVCLYSLRHHYYPSYYKFAENVSLDEVDLV